MGMFQGTDATLRTELDGIRGRGGTVMPRTCRLVGFKVEVVTETMVEP